MVIEAEQKIKLIQPGKLLLPFPLTRDMRNSNFSLVAVQEKLKEVTKKYARKDFMNLWLSVIGQETFAPPYHNGKTSQFVRWMTAVSVLYLPSAKSARAMLNYAISITNSDPSSSVCIMPSFSSTFVQNLQSGDTAKRAVLKDFVGPFDNRNYTF